MRKNFKYNLIHKYLFFSIVIFITLSIFQQSNNALPFFYKSYPTYVVNGKKDFDSSSEALILNRIDFTTLALKYKSHFNLWAAYNETRAFNNYRTTKNYNKDYITTENYILNGHPYQSQIGFQALFLTTLSDILKVKHGDYSLLKHFTVLLISLCAAIVILWMGISFGKIPSLMGLLFFTLSTGVNIFSESLYWSIWMFILPLSIICLLDIFKVKNKYLIFLFVFPAFLIKFLSGYEFITVIVMTAMTPYAWDYFVNKNLTALSRAITVGISSVIAFLITILIYNYFFMIDFDSSGIDYILGRSESWSLKNLDGTEKNPLLQSSKILIMNFMDINGYGIPLIGFLILHTIIIIYFRKNIQPNNFKFICFLLIGSISWFLVQPGHILFHPRYATLILFFPFGFFIPSFLLSLFLKKS